MLLFFARPRYVLPLVIEFARANSSIRFLPLHSMILLECGESPSNEGGRVRPEAFEHPLPPPLSQTHSTFINHPLPPPPPLLGLFSTAHSLPIR